MPSVAQAAFGEGDVQGDSEQEAAGAEAEPDVGHPVPELPRETELRRTIGEASSLAHMASHSLATPKYG